MDLTNEAMYLMDMYSNAVAALREDTAASSITIEVDQISNTARKYNPSEGDILTAKLSDVEVFIIDPSTWPADVVTYNNIAVFYNGEFVINTGD